VCWCQLMTAPARRGGSDVHSGWPSGIARVGKLDNQAEDNDEMRGVRCITPEGGALRQDHGDIATAFALVVCVIPGDLLYSSK
jgi:hypothetical protein